MKPLERMESHAYACVYVCCELSLGPSCAIRRYFKTSRR